MKTTTRIVMIAAILAAGGMGELGAAVHAGESAPDFTAVDIAGRTQALAQLKGRIVVLEWTNPECPFVRKHYESGNLPRLQREAKDAGIAWLSINSGRPGAQGDFDDTAAAAWLRAKGAAPTAYLRDRDGKIGRLYGAKATPHLFVIDASGKVVYDGAIDSIRSAEAADISRATNYVRAALSDLQAGRPVAKRSTPPYGCGVHY